MNATLQIRMAIDQYCKIFGTGHYNNLEIKIGPHLFYLLCEEMSSIKGSISKEFIKDSKIFGIPLDTSHYINGEIVIMDKTDVDRERYSVTSVSELPSVKKLLLDRILSFGNALAMYQSELPSDLKYQWNDLISMAAKTLK